MSREEIKRIKDLDWDNHPQIRPKQKHICCGTIYCDVCHPKSEPEPTEFTINYRKEKKVFHQMKTHKGEDLDLLSKLIGQVQVLLEMGDEACDIIDRLTASCKLFESIVKQLRAELKAKDEQIKNLNEQSKREKKRLEKALKEQGLTVGPFVNGPDIRD